MSCLLLPAVGTRRIVLFSREKLTHLVLNKVFYLFFFFLSILLVIHQKFSHHILFHRNEVLISWFTFTSSIKIELLGIVH